MESSEERPADSECSGADFSELRRPFVWSIFLDIQDGPAIRYFLL
jgi:hypothetical protein